MTTVAATLAAAGLSDIGNVRETNQDAFLVDLDRGLFVVADGMGGHRGGATAAHAVIEHFPALLDRYVADTGGRVGVALRGSILELSSMIRMAGERSPENRGMGTTIACLLFTGDMAFVAHMGDSRVYLWRRGMRALTRDHSLTALLVREGEISQRAAARHPGRGQLTRFVGMEQEIYPDVSRIEVRPGDRFLLCTDGLWQSLPDKRMGRLLATGDDPETICRTLIDEGKTAGGDDNLTAVVVAVAK